jgi:hypothetical protein
MTAGLQNAGADSRFGPAIAPMYADFPAYFGRWMGSRGTHGPRGFGYTQSSDGAGNLGVGSNTRRTACRLPCLAHLVIKPESSHPLRGRESLPGADGAGSSG